MRVVLLVLILLLNASCNQRLNESRSSHQHIEEIDKLSNEQNISNNKFENKALFQLAWGLIF